MIQHPVRRLAAAALVFASLALFFAAPGALAQDSGDESTDEVSIAVAPELLLVDAGANPVVLIRTSTEPSEVSIAIGSAAADTSNPTQVGTTNLSQNTMLVIDNGVRSADLLDEFVTAASEYVRRAPGNESIGIYTTGGTGRARLGLNDDQALILETLGGLVASSDESRLWDAVRGAGLDLAATGSGVGLTNVIVFAGSADAGSTSEPVTARAAVVNAGASALVIAYDGNEVPSGSLERLAAASPGGAYASASEPALIEAYGESISNVVSGTYVVAFSSGEIGDNNAIKVTVDGVTIDASYVAGSTATGPALDPFVERSRPGVSFLQGSLGKNLGLILGALAAMLGAYAIAMIFHKDPSGLSYVLQPYADPHAGQLPDDEENSFAKNLFVKRAVEFTENLAERQGTLERTEALLERADMPLRAGEAMTAYAGIILAGFVLGFVISGNLIGAAIVMVAATLLPPAVVKFLAGRRKKAFLSQLPDTLQLLSSTLKAGYSFMQGVEAVSQEVEDPMGSELRRVVTEAQLGRPLEEALNGSADRMESADFSWAVMAVQIQREVGGNLSELLLTVAETMTARERLRRDVAALTAEGKMSAIVLGALPIMLGFAMYVINPEYISTLFEDSLGQILLGASIVAALLGFAWMKKIINIDI